MTVMRYGLRTQLVLLAILPLLLAVGWVNYYAWQRESHRQAIQKRLDEAADIGLHELFRVMEEVSDNGRMPDDVEIPQVGRRPNLDHTPMLLPNGQPVTAQESATPDPAAPSREAGN
jgi:hypothetical protein